MPNRLPFRFLVLVLVAAATIPFLAKAQKDLRQIEAQVRQSYPGATQLGPDDFDKLRSSGSNVLLLDAREPEEFKVSHLPDAIQVPPAMSSATFIGTFGQSIKGKTVVVYCSVGVRSSKFVERITRAATDAGAASVYNLEGGIFRWHNEKRALEGGSSSTDEIHPYSSSWQTYLDRTDRAAYEPGATTKKK